MLSVLYLCRIVEFATKDDMKTAMKKLQGHEINRKKIKLSVVCYDILISIYTVQFTKVYQSFLLSRRKLEGHDHVLDRDQRIDGKYDKLCKSV